MLQTLQSHQRTVSKVDGDSSGIFLIEVDGADRRFHLAFPETTAGIIWRGTIGWMRHENGLLDVTAKV